jgi:ribosomal protein L11
VITFFNITSSNVNIPALRLAIAQFLGIDVSNVFVQHFNGRRRDDQASVKVTVQTPVNQSKATATALTNAPTTPTFLPAVQAAVPGATSTASTVAAIQDSDQNSNSSSGRYLSTGAIVGIAVGVGVGLLLVLALGVMLFRRKRYTRGTVDPAQPGRYQYPGQSVV